MMSTAMRLLLIAAAAAAAHLAVLALRRASRRLMGALPKASFAKARSLASLLTSAAIFALYFSAVGLALREAGVSLTAYLASASVLGLAVGFGSQGLVQDVVAGLTVIFSDLLNVDDMVEIGGQTGVVQSIGMRFVTLRNHLGAEVHIPNRTVANVVNYPLGYIHCILDVVLTGDEALAERMQQRVAEIVAGAVEQYGGVFVRPPTVAGRRETAAGKRFLRVKLRIWPGRGAVIENSLRPEIVAALREMDPGYNDWMVTVNYEIEQRTPAA